jgi:hypothetical protein
LVPYAASEGWKRDEGAGRNPSAANDSSRRCAANSSHSRVLCGPDQSVPMDEAIAEADTLLLTVPNQLGVAYNVHVLEAILTTVAPALGWR